MDIEQELLNPVIERIKKDRDWLVEKLFSSLDEIEETKKKYFPDTPLYEIIYIQKPGKPNPNLIEYSKDIIEVVKPCMLESYGLEHYNIPYPKIKLSNFIISSYKIPSETIFLPKNGYIRISDLPHEFGHHLAKHLYLMYFGLSSQHLDLFLDEATAEATSLYCLKKVNDNKIYPRNIIDVNERELLHLSVFIALNFDDNNIDLIRLLNDLKDKIIKEVDEELGEYLSSRINDPEFYFSPYAIGGVVVTYLMEHIGNRVIGDLLKGNFENILKEIKA
ncbi:MAG: hypothetical protein QW197_03315 [Candidatus Aenigmatarchaeota archaeon]